jgi:uncharacterized protein YndB with AHSA1/START domain
MPDILHKFQIAAPPAKVFDAFCSPEGLNSWWTLRCNGRPEKGELYNFYFAPEYDWFAEVIHVIPGKELTWKMTGAMEDWMETQVGFQLAPDEKGTAVLFFHSDWKEPSDHFAITNYCWGQLLNGLKQYVENGKIIPFEQRN